MKVVENRVALLRHYEGLSQKLKDQFKVLKSVEENIAQKVKQHLETTVKLIPEGIEGQVPYKGPVNNIIYQLVGGLKASMGYTGNENIKQMKKNCNFIKISGAGLSESHVHDVRITNESPNYSKN